MVINILKGTAAHLEDCYDALMKSDIGRAYFQDFDSQNILMDGLKNKEIDVALDNSKKFLSFIWYERYGAFGMHTYLHMIAVKEKYRRTSDCKDEAYGLVLTFSPKVLTIE